MDVSLVETRMRILVVDDHPKIRANVRAFIKLA